MSKRDVYLVGTVPLLRNRIVFKTLAEIFGDKIARVPDGEIGDRGLWILSQYPRLAEAAGIEFGKLPADGFVRRHIYEVPLRAKAGVTEKDIEFGSLGYANYARVSYEMFRTLKKAGEIPSHWRFQVDLPTPMDVMPFFEPSSRPVVEPAYERAMLREVEAIQSFVPHDELSIVWDAVKGVLVWEDPEKTAAYVEPWFDQPKEGSIDRHVRMAEAIATDVELGFHLCYGDQNSVHAFQPKDLGACVDFANAIAHRISRPVDLVHMPVPIDRNDDAYFAPLARLDRSRVRRVYLGLIHFSEGIEGAKRKIAAAEKHLADFGIATECGLGRKPADQIIPILQLHADLAA